MKKIVLIMLLSVSAIFAAFAQRYYIIGSGAADCEANQGTICLDDVVCKPEMIN